MKACFTICFLSHDSVNSPLSVRPVIIPFSFGDIPSNPGDVVQLNCFVTKGDSPLDIEWQFQGIHLDTPSSLPTGAVATRLGDRASVLMVNPVLPTHQGHYRCIAKNPAGAAFHSAVLVVNGMSCSYIGPVNIVHPLNVVKCNSSFI